MKISFGNGKVTFSRRESQFVKLEKASVSPDGESYGNLIDEVVQNLINRYPKGHSNGKLFPVIEAVKRAEKDFFGGDKRRTPYFRKRLSITGNQVVTAMRVTLKGELNYLYLVELDANNADKGAVLFYHKEPLTPLEVRESILNPKYVFNAKKVLSTIKVSKALMRDPQPAV